jgi:hypothetical protein
MPGLAGVSSEGEPTLGRVTQSLHWLTWSQGAH